MIRVNNHKLEVVREEKRRREKMVEKRKTKAMTMKHCKDRRGFSLFNEEKANYKSNIKDDTDWDQADNKYLL